MMSREGLNAVMALGAVAAAGVGLTFFAWGGLTPNAGRLAACDRAIEKQLKAPTTYRRVSSETQSGGFTIVIDYDADNSFGVPIRGHGHCDVIPPSDALWFDDRANLLPAQGSEAPE